MHGLKYIIIYAIRASKNHKDVSDTLQLDIEARYPIKDNKYFKQLSRESDWYGPQKNLNITEKHFGDTGIVEIDWVMSNRTRMSTAHKDYLPSPYRALFQSIGHNEIEKIQKILRAEESFISIYALIDEDKKQSFAELLYLLFVTEVMKNSACAIIHPMMLELALTHTPQTISSWLCDSMPVAEEGAISASRGMDLKLYNKYTDLPTSFDRSLGSDYKGLRSYPMKELHDSKTRILAAKEAQIFKDWLELKEPGITSHNPLNMVSISQHISGLCDRWYGFTLDKTINLPNTTHRESIINSRNWIISQDRGV